MNKLLYDLQDGEASSTAHPDTFEMPPRGARENLQLGQTIKLIFRNRLDRPSERLWLEVVERLDGPRYRGRLLHPPFGFVLLDPDAEVEFGPEHVVQIWTEDEE